MLRRGSVSQGSGDSKHAESQRGGRWGLRGRWGLGMPCGSNSISLKERLHLVVKCSARNPASMCAVVLLFIFNSFLFKKKIKRDLRLVDLFAHSEKVMI